MALFKLISLVAILSVVAECRGNYYGKLIGQFVRQGNTQAEHHNVAGTVYAVDDNTLQIIGFTYDGTASDAFFYIGTSGTPSANGYVIPKAVGLGSEQLGEYSNADLTIHLDTTQGPGSISDYVWISVWSEADQANFADVFIPADFTSPQEYSLGRLGFSPPRYDVSADDAIILNSKQIRFVGLTYDGRGPAVYFWMDTQSSSLTSRTGRRVPQVGESSASRLTQRLSDVTRTVQLPGDTTVFDIRSIGLWCDAAKVNFGHVTIPGDLESRGVVIPFVPAPDLPAYDNCEVLEADEYQVSWTIDGDDIAIGLASRQSFNEYMAFGPSGSDSETTMERSDVIVAFIDSETSMGRVEDYYLSAYAMCTANDGEGVCPDTLGKPGTNDVTLSGFSTDDGITRINFRRPLSATDQYDRAISTTGPQFISWALGPINEDGRATYHGPDNRTPENKQINFGRESSSCPAFTMRTSDDSFNSFEVDPIIALEDTEFRCDIGRAGGQKGYQGITGRVGWGISWYINGNLIPEITVKRNQTYTFKVYGGSDPSQPASYHPFYITTDPAGGYYQLPDAARGNHEIIAGPVSDDTNYHFHGDLDVYAIFPQLRLGKIATSRSLYGSYCFYDDTADTPNPDDTDTYQEYRDTLQLNCPNGDGSPGTLVWTPDANTPDLVFYQCYTHRFLGWKIHVKDDANKCVLSLITMVTTIITAILIMFRNA